VKIALAALGGLLVALGLGVAGLTDARKIVGFLDIAGHWDPTALVVLGAAVLVYGTAYRLIEGGVDAAAPLGAPPRADRSLILGAALFGVGWGASGLCPAPALVAAVTGAPPLLVFVAAMAAGMMLHRAGSAVVRRRAEPVAPSPPPACG
jgi:uncharacterized protein